MTDPAHEIDTGVVSSRARLPEPPSLWSYSALRDVKECALRYALTRASYPDLWDRRGYPSLPSTPAIFGNVVHGALETVVRALAYAGVESPKTEEASQVLRGLGGLTAVVEARIGTELATLNTNPRLTEDRLRRIGRELHDQTSLACAQVQSYLSRTKVVPGAPRRQCATESGNEQLYEHVRGELQGGSHAEVTLVADDLRLYGRIDLVTISNGAADIVDYKTGAESEGHHDQLRLYALLWDSDRQANPKHLPVSGLTGAYRDRDVVVEVPLAEELRRLATSLTIEVSGADAELESGVPIANPSTKNCGRCVVRHLCSSYWHEVVPKLDDVNEGGWFDYEGIIGEQNGPRSWWLADSTSGKPELLLRTSSPTVPFREGDCVRFLGLRREADPELQSPVASLTVTTEVFRVEAA